MKWEPLSRRSTPYLTAGVISLGISYLAFITKQPVSLLGKHGQILAICDLTGVFRVTSLIALATGCCLLSTAIRRSVSQKLNGHPSASSAGLKRLLFRRSRIWILVNGALVPFAVWAGYESLNPLRLQGTNPDAVLCIVLIVLIPLLLMGWIHFSRPRLKRPSWNRSPLLFGRTAPGNLPLISVSWCNVCWKPVSRARIRHARILDGRSLRKHVVRSANWPDGYLPAIPLPDRE